VESVLGGKTVCEAERNNRKILDERSVRLRALQSVTASATLKRSRFVIYLVLKITPTIHRATAIFFFAHDEEALAVAHFSPKRADFAVFFG
jgi:hypothetical protein